MSDYLSEEEQISRLRDWWKRNGTFVVVAVLLAIVGVVGWRWYDSHSAERLARAADLYEEFTESTGDARDAIAEQLRTEGDSTAYPALVLLQRARAAADSGDLEAAAGYLAEAIGAASGGELADLARLRLGRVQYGLDHHEEALKTLAAIREPGFVPVAQELSGDIHLSKGDRAKAHAAYSAALEGALSQDQEAILELKVADTADASTPADA